MAGQEREEPYDPSVIKLIGFHIFELSTRQQIFKVLRSRTRTKSSMLTPGRGPGTCHSVEWLILYHPEGQPGNAVF